ncbi:CRISPR-associated endonuclease Cas2 [Clostridium sp. NSJ-145]|uniref:CRISPR-associated endonuclease Cas2 n=1 Tax=Clostridium sp. NSJ-145 TaxID=2897777 RepID=UPI001E2A3FF0|nr:CRISPR-associated endonuclease Cas2 [Clostridium sp. NSJ-145]MCD2503229.1 CRISPR-associated endonuclease Cas2 [Clostridium sp. NSJ-145]MDY3359763.1 CRISPR-associated endonuclease Cas2 [Clostridium celatum]
MYVILVYDIKTDYQGQRILNKTFKICKKYLSHIQNSVFEGELAESQIVKLKYELDGIIRKDVDSIILFKSRNEKWLNKEMLGKQEDKTSNFI